MRENLYSAVTNLDHVKIAWLEQPRKEDKEMRFLCRDIFGLLDMFAKSELGDDHYMTMSPIRIIIITGFKCEDGYDFKVKDVMRTFVNHYSNYNCIIATQAAPTISSTSILWNRYNQDFEGMIASPEWQKEYKKICDEFESFGFESINDYCGFKSNHAYVYTNELGSLVIEQARKMSKNKGE